MATTVVFIFIFVIVVSIVGRIECLLFACARFHHFYSIRRTEIELTKFLKFSLGPTFGFRGHDIFKKTVNHNYLLTETVIPGRKVTFHFTTPINIFIIFIKKTYSHDTARCRLKYTTTFHVKIYIILII